MARKRWTAGEKLKILRELAATQAQGGFLKGVARKYSLQPSQLRKWRASQGRLMNTRKGKKAMCSGPASSIAHLEQQLIGWAMVQRAADIPITYRHIQAKACRLDQNFRALPPKRQYFQIRQLCKINAFVLRRKTTQAPQHPQETLDDALAWLDIARPLVSAPNQQKKFILNMDQTPVYFSMPPGTTLEIQESDKVGIRTTTSSTDRATCSLTVSADGDKLKPMLIFKGEPAGRIATRELPTFQTRAHVSLACQPNAWQDDSNMLKWIDNVLVPWCQTRAQGAPVLLFLDSFSSHHSASTTERLMELDIQTHQLPGGCTGLVQPVDVGVGKPFKDRLRRLWWDWVIDDQDEESPVLTNATREMVAYWVHQAWSEFPRDIVRNSWCKTGLSYFPDDVNGDNGDNNN